MGILQPNLRHRFQIHFLDAYKNPLPFSDQLSRQVISIDGLNQVEGQKYANVFFQDDVRNEAIKGCYRCSKDQHFGCNGYPPLHQLLWC